MIPNHTTSTRPIFGYFITPKDEEPSPILAKDWGGIALNDPSRGLLYQIWQARIVSGVNFITKVYVESDNQPPIEIYSAIGIFNISLTFDQNMNPVYAYLELGQAKFRWYDSLIQDYTTTVLPAGSGAPICVLDDKRQFAGASSDVLVVYTRGGALYYREQRDRYAVEYLLEPSVVGDVLVAGMTTVNRIQFAIGLIDQPEYLPIKRSVVGGRGRKTTQNNIRKVIGGSYE